MTLRDFLMSDFLDGRFEVICRRAGVGKHAGIWKKPDGECGWFILGQRVGGFTSRKQAAFALRMTLWLRYNRLAPSVVVNR